MNKTTSEKDELLELELKNLLLILNAAPDKLPSRRVYSMIIDYCKCRVNHAITQEEYQG